jgi:hypothetical protein
MDDRQFDLMYGAYQDGQLLRARDLQRDVQSETLLRNWHTVVLHNAWGIGLGLEVDVQEDGQVTVGPGCALDCRGREMVLAETKTVALPPAKVTNRKSAVWMLVIHHQPLDGADITASSGHAQLSWQNPEAVRVGLELPLAAVRVAGGQVSIDSRLRCYVRPQTRPYVASGQTMPGAQWTPWPADQEPVGWFLRVDTGNAGFIEAPHYFATLAGDAFSTRYDFSLFTSINEASGTGFAFVLLPVWPRLGVGFDQLAAQFRHPPVAWLGVEPSVSCGQLRGKLYYRVPGLYIEEVMTP